MDRPHYNTYDLLFHIHRQDWLNLYASLPFINKQCEFVSDLELFISGGRLEFVDEVFQGKRVFFSY